MKRNLLIGGIIVIIILIVGISTYFMFFNTEEFKVTLLNTSDEKMQIECFIFQNSKSGYNFTTHATYLAPDEVYTFQFTNDESFNIYKIAIRTINYTYYTNTAGSGRWNGASEYMFSGGEVHDLLAVITPVPYGFNISNISDGSKYNIGNTNLTPIDITIVKMTEPNSKTVLDFTKK